MRFQACTTSSPGITSFTASTNTERTGSKTFSPKTVTATRPSRGRTRSRNDRTTPGMSSTKKMPSMHSTAS